MNKNNRGESTVDTLVTIMFYLVCCGFASMAGCAMGEKEVRIAAVKKGYAEWVVDDTGKTTFTWKCDKQLEKGKSP